MLRSEGVKVDRYFNSASSSRDKLSRLKRTKELTINVPSNMVALRPSVRTSGAWWGARQPRGRVAKTGDAQRQE